MNKTTTPQAAASAAAYENNPFYIATKGIDLLFKHAQSVGIVIGVVLALSFFSNMSGVFVPQPAADESRNVPMDTSGNTTPTAESFSNFIHQIPVETYLFAGLAILIVALIVSLLAIYISGVIDYTSAKISKGQNTSIGEAMAGALKGFWGYA